MKTFERTRKLDALQPPYSLFRREIEQEILPYTSAQGIGVLVYGPLAHGLLAGSYTPQTTFASDDWRSKSEIFHGEIFQRNLAVVERLKLLAEQEGMSVVQLALAWVLAQPAVDVAIIGARTPTQLAQTAQAGDMHLTPATLGEIEYIMREAVPIGGPAPEGM
jgi:aryl-alcohol dehydrogenase-like predicted oxidoreductase